MPDVVFVIAPKVFRDEEYFHPKEILEARGASVTTASVAPGTCEGKLGQTAVADISVLDATTRTWDAVVFVGGGGAQVYFDDPAAHVLAKNALENGSILAAICIAPTILAHAGLLDGIRVTSFPDQEQELRKYGAVWTGEPVTVDGQIITANGPSSAKLFGEEIAVRLGL